MMSLESANDRDGGLGFPGRKQNGLDDAPDVWSSILVGLCQLMHAKISLMATVDRSRRRVSVHGSANIGDGYLQSDAIGVDLLAPLIDRAVDAADLGVIWTASDGEGAGGEDANDVFARWLRPQGIAHVICGLLTVQEPQATYLTIGRAREAGPYNGDDIDLFASLLPCIRMTFRSLRLIEGVQDERQTLLSLLDRLPTGVALLNQRREPVLMNDYARRALADIGDLDALLPQPYPQRRPDHGRAAEGRKQPALDDVAAGACVHVIRRSAGYRPLSIIVQKLPMENSGPDNEKPAFALIISDPNRAIELDHVALCRLYGLTPAEGRLAALLASGKHIESAAHLLGVSIHTVRTHLKHIFSKTETSSQSDLVRLILSAPAPIRTV
jgi:DNA-binding CsgD family transcriptional regulator